MENEARMTNKITGKTSGSTKEGKIHKYTTEWKNRKTTDKSDKTTRRIKSKDICERRETQMISRQSQAIQTKQDIPK